MLVVAGDPDLDRHLTGPEHPERPERVEAALGGIADCGLVESAVVLAPRRASTEELVSVHSRGYVERLRGICESGGGMLDADTVLSPGSYDTALLAAGAGLAAADAIERGEGEVAFVAARPPGHHARPEAGMGFCLFNNVAIAARSLADRGERVLIIDWDVHHGNGTQEIFWDDSRVLYASLHQWPLYPGTGRLDETGGPAAPGTTLNIPLPPGVTGDVILRALDEVVAPAVESFAPSWVLVSAGFDGHRDDPLAGWRLTAGDYADISRRVTGFAPRPFAGGIAGRQEPASRGDRASRASRASRVVMFLEGGYNLRALRLSVGATLCAATGGSYRPEPASSGGPGTPAVEAARKNRHMEA
ncbi:MAG: histone deacetylase family protein [Acidimicrobiales bacterium]